MQLVNAVTEEQLKNVRQLYFSAFPLEERKPFELILEKSDAGYVEILAIESDEGDFLGLAISISCDDLLLLDYFAVMPQCRGQGVGTQALELLLKRYTGRRFFLEIENTQAAGPDVDQRLRRKAFYSAGGFSAVKWRVNLLGVDMEIMTWRCAVSFEEYHSLYENVFTKRLSDRVRLICEE